MAATSVTYQRALGSKTTRNSYDHAVDLSGISRVVAVSLLLLMAAGVACASSSVQINNAPQLGKDLHFQPSVSLAPEKRGPFCFEDKCTCHKKIADCSHNFGALTFVPRVVVNSSYMNLKGLNFSFNNLKSVSDDFFKTVTMFTSFSWLDLSSNNLTHIAPGAFHTLKHLTKLILDNNNLSYKDFSTLFPSRFLQSLSLVSAGLGKMPDDFFKADSAPALEYLDLSFNKLGQLNFSTLAYLKRIQNLRVNGCELHDEGVVSFAIPSLEELSVSDNALFRLPQSCDPREKGKSFFPKLRKLLFRGNVISNLNDAYCFPLLQHLDMGNTHFTEFTKDMFSESKFPSLTTLFVTNIRRIQKIESYAFRHPSLQTLSITYSLLTLRIIQRHAFAGCPRLCRLLLSHSQLGGDNVSPENISELFDPIPDLQILDLGGCGIRQITPDTFGRFQQLRTLRLGHNKLTELPDGTFDDLLNLKSLTLSFNELKTINEKTFGVETRKRLKKLNLSGNKFSCDCDILWFKAWLTSSPKVFAEKNRGYYCQNDPRYPLSQLMLRQQACYFSQATYKFIIAVITMILIVFTVITVVFQFRWHIRLLMYETFRGDGEARQRRLRENHFAFDVFVSYAQADLPWVRQHIMPELEEKLGLKLCIHERDFIIGNNIVDNIAECVESSKKVLMVFSRSFVTSHWCQFELNYCLNHVMEHDDALVVTCIGDLTTMEPTGAMMAVLKTTTYIQWQESVQARAAFWGRLKLALGEILQDDFV